MPFPNAAAWTARGVRPPAHCTRTHATDDEDEDADVAMTTQPATRRRRCHPPPPSSSARARAHTQTQKTLTAPAVRHHRRTRRRPAAAVIATARRTSSLRSPKDRQRRDVRQRQDTTSQRAHDARTHDANTAPHRHIDIVTATARPLGAYPSAQAAAEARERRAMSLAPTRLRRTPAVHSKSPETRPRVAVLVLAWITWVSDGPYR